VASQSPGSGPLEMPVDNRSWLFEIGPTTWSTCILDPGTEFAMDAAHPCACTRRPIDGRRPASKDFRRSTAEVQVTES